MPIKGKITTAPIKMIADVADPSCFDFIVCTY
jgi:hypothetical protein